MMKVFSGSIRNKLILAVAALLLSAVTAVVFISYSRYSANTRDVTFDAISERSRILATQFQRETQHTLDRARDWGLQALQGADLRALMDGDAAIQAVRVWDMTAHTFTKEAWQKGFSLIDFPAVPDTTWTALPLRKQIYSLEVGPKKSFHRLVVGLVSSGERIEKALVVDIDPQAFAQFFKGEGAAHKVLFSDDGKLLFGGETTSSLFSGGSVPGDLSQRVSASQLAQETLVVKAGADHANYLSSYARTGLPGVNVGVMIDEAEVLAEARKVVRQSAYLGIAILGLALVFAAFFSDTLVRPILALMEAARKVSAGDFNVAVKPTTKDELATLSNAFNEMTKGLAERERLKEVFGKFHSKAVFKKLLDDGTVKLGGNRLPVTVFFSDIRSFTTTSEQMAPEQVVEMLNEYMQEMVTVVEKYDGVVDKFVGDAIMAIWGLPEASPAADAERAVRACLDMRQKLVELNVRRKARGQFEINIGMGLNSGEVVAGNIGSSSRMEYTVIGDTVNTAARMESLTKEMNVDFLINESTMKLLPEGMVELEGPWQVKAKGKAELVNVYGVKGLSQRMTSKAA